MRNTLLAITVANMFSFIRASDIEIPEPPPTIPDYDPEWDCYYPSFSEPCDWQTHYYSWLSCKCHPLFQCEIFCVDSALSPFEICSGCLPEEEVQLLVQNHYPKYATEEMI